MPLDKETALKIAHRKATKFYHGQDLQFSFNALHMNDFAQAIYELGVKEERERAFNVAKAHSHRPDDMGAIIAGAIGNTP